MRLESQWREPPPGGAPLATVAVELLSREPSRRARWMVRQRAPKSIELANGARRAIALHLAGIYRLGLKQPNVVDPAIGLLADDLDRAQRVEMADSLVASHQAAEALRAMLAGGIRPVVLKGWSLADRLWPRPWMRPPGDLDVLVEEEALGDTIRVLAQLGFRPSQGEVPGRWRPVPSGIDMWRSGPGVSVDVHTRLFRTVGSGFAARDVLSRATPGSLLGVPVRLLAPADEILFLLIHAAKHGAVRAKWMLDLHAVRLTYPPEVWAEAAERAIASGTTRPVWAAVRLLGRQLQMSAEVKRAIRPPLLARALISGLVRASETGRHLPFVPWPAYALEWFLEDRVARRITRLLGVIERILSVGSRIAPCGRPSTAAELRSDRWLEGVLRGGRGALWVTLKGSSMVPSVRPGDDLLVTPVRPGETLREGDLLVARRAGFLVVHRLVRKLEDAIVMRGDGAWTDDSPIPERDVLARVIGIRHRTK